jgi:RNA polymerase sigma-70 factor (ECF subfamily)
MISEKKSLPARDRHFVPTAAAWAPPAGAAAWPGKADGSAPRTGAADANQAMGRYAVGEEDAFAVLYDELAPRLYRYLLRQTRERGRAEDLLQQTMLQIHCSRGRFLLGADVTPWAFAIARRLLIDSIRRRKRESAANDWLSSLDPLTEPASDELLHSKRVAEALERQLSQLPKAQRTTFELIKQDGLSLREAAKAMGTTVNAVKLRAHRAYVALRESIPDHGERWLRAAD